ncbi:uncharacterized protein LOC134207151 [Armigeres subalbatus]|uniref:uncharacterized protein LOC134207151 n=1 Tax=Armigeres subalbatus TaxID=124917 RepID=UPI002ED391C1
MEAMTISGRPGTELVYCPLKSTQSNTQQGQKRDFSKHCRKHCQDFFQPPVREFLRQLKFRGIALLTNIPYSSCCPQRWIVSTAQLLFVFLAISKYGARFETCHRRIYQNSQKKQLPKKHNCNPLCM